jgi:glycerol transport system ATP-binding protein
VLFDEPLTVIDPHLKWQLRRKLKQIHHELKLTLIYVTHDQVEALTFAEQVVVMTRGRAVQIGSASELFDRPQHTFVGHFIGSPGMNFLPAEARDEGLVVAGRRVAAAPAALRGLGPLTLGVRPEYVTLATAEGEGAVRATVTRAQDIGTYWLVTAQVGEDAASVVRARLGSHGPVPKPGDAAWLRIVGPRTCFYGADRNLVAEGAAS